MNDGKNKWTALLSSMKSGRPPFVSKLVPILICAFVLAHAAIPEEKDGSLGSRFDTKAIDSFLHRSMTTYRIPGLSVAIIADGSLLFAKGYGSDDGVAINADTPFLLGSTSKTFTALAVMSLVENGVLDLDAAITKYLPDLHLTMPENFPPITVRHLLNHTSGLTDAGMPKLAMGEPDLASEVALVSRCVPTTEAGETYTYFNGNYRLLGAIVERASGKSFGAFLESALVKPLGLTATYAGPIGVADLASGHRALFGFPIEGRQQYRPGALPSGYIVSSANDAARLLLAELGAVGGERSPLNANTVRSTWTAPGPSEEGYAMGWLLHRGDDGRIVLIHGGSLECYASFFYLDPERRSGFVLLVNQGGLLPMIDGFSTLRGGLISFIQGESFKKGRNMAFFVSLILFIILGVEVVFILNVYLGNHHPRLGGVILELVITFALLLAFLPIMNRVMRDRIDWSTLVSLLPESLIIVVIVAFSALLRAAIKIARLAGLRDSGATRG